MGAVYNATTLYIAATEEIGSVNREPLHHPTPSAAPAADVLTDSVRKTEGPVQGQDLRETGNDDELWDGGGQGLHDVMF